MFTNLYIKNKPILPGLGLSVGVAILAKLLALLVPKLGGATLAILLGIILGNTIFKQPALAVGTKFSESRLLEYSVVLLGFTVTFQTIGEMGLKGLIFIILIMATVISGAYWFGRKLGFNEKMALMMAGGQSTRNRDDADAALLRNIAIRECTIKQKRSAWRNLAVSRTGRRWRQLSKS